MCRDFLENFPGICAAEPVVFDLACVLEYAPEFPEVFPVFPEIAGLLVRSFRK